MIPVRLWSIPGGCQAAPSSDSQSSMCTSAAARTSATLRPDAGAGPEHAVEADLGRVGVDLDDDEAAVEECHLVE